MGYKKLKVSMLLMYDMEFVVTNTPLKNVA